MVGSPLLRKRLGVLVSIGLLLTLAVTFLTGFLAAALDLNRFVYHKYAAYLVIALAVVHVVWHWRSLVGQVRRWWLGRAPPLSPGAVRAAPRDAVAPAPRLSRRALLGPGAALAAGASLGHWLGNRGPAFVLEEGEDLGQVYHAWSQPSYAGTLSKSLHVRPQPAPYKTYPHALTVALPPLPAAGGLPLEVALQRRRSIREYAARPLTLAELSRLLGHSAGATDRRDPTLAFRAVPSSGALYPIEVYPVVFDVAGLESGVYHYAVQPHQLELVRPGDFRQEVFHAAVSQEMLLHASLVLVLTGLYDRVQWKYVDRSYRYLMLEAGHLGQNVYLTATSLGLGPCGIGAFFDDQLNRLLEVDGRNEVTVYLLAIGPTTA